MMNYREQFEKETGKTTGIMFAHSVGFRNEYVLWLESKLSTMKVSEEVAEKIWDGAREKYFDSLYNDWYNTYSTFESFQSQNPDLFQSQIKDKSVTDWDEMYDRYMKAEKWGHLETIRKVFEWMKHQPEFKQGI